jgi:hypothetical protein
MWCIFPGSRGRMTLCLVKSLWRFLELGEFRRYKSLRSAPCEAKKTL